MENQKSFAASFHNEKLTFLFRGAISSFILSSISEKYRDQEKKEKAKIRIITIVKTQNKWDSNMPNACHSEYNWEQQKNKF